MVVTSMKHGLFVAMSQESQVSRKCCFRSNF